MRRHGSMAILAGFAVMLVMYLLEGCASSPRYPESVLDTPELHLSNGYKLMKKELLDDAEKEFSAAIRLDPRSSSAHKGMGLLKGFKKDFPSAFDYMKLAKSLAGNSSEEAMVHVGLMRLYTMNGGDEWLREVEKNFWLSQSRVRMCAECYYYLGIAYKHAYRFKDAERAFMEVLKIREGFLSEADEQIGIIKRIESARPVTEVGRRIGIQDRITKADAAALILYEFGIDGLSDEGPLQKDLPVLQTSDGPRHYLTKPPALDIENHPLRREIEAILRINIKELGLYPDGTFGPDLSVTRASFAVMFADIIGKLKKDPSLSTRYAGEGSPFKDVRNDAPYFNAIMVCRAWDAVNEAENGLFNPKDSITGYDALFMIRKIKERIEHPS